MHLEAAAQVVWNSVCPLEPEARTHAHVNKAGASPQGCDGACSKGDEIELGGGERDSGLRGVVLRGGELAGGKAGPLC